MPLAGHHRVITCRAEHFCHRRAVGAEMVLIRRAVGCLARVGSVVVNHVADTDLMRITPRQQSRARRTASRLIIELRKRHATPGQTIDVGRRYFRAETANVGIAQIVGQNQNNVRTRHCG